jgi:protein SCO1/2
MKFFKSFFLALTFFSMGIVGCEKNEVLKENQKPESLKTIKAAPVFTAENFDGKVFKGEDLIGKVWVGSLFFTNCQGPCPMLTSRLSVLKNAHENDKNAAFVSISVDPVNDSLPVLKKYAEQHGATVGGNWYFVRMPKDSMERVITKGFLLSGKDQPEVHSTHFFLVDEAGQIRGYYDGLDEKKVVELENDMQSLLKAN